LSPPLNNDGHVFWSGDISPRISAINPLQLLFPASNILRAFYWASIPAAVTNKAFVLAGLEREELIWFF
jgi:hypothetical protein